MDVYHKVSLNLPFIKYWEYLVVQNLLLYTKYILTLCYLTFHIRRTIRFYLTCKAKEIDK